MHGTGLAAVPIALPAMSFLMKMMANVERQIYSVAGAAKVVEIVERS
jgi:hypothetical protein